MKDNNIFYVYTWTDPETKVVFYVGKGQGRRAYKSHIYQRCNNKLNKILERGHTMNDIVTIIESNLNEEAALDKEELLIDKYKRLEDGGTLFNYLTGRGIKGSPVKLTDPADVALAIEMYENGHNAKEVGAKFGVHETTILSRLKKWGINVRCPGFSTFSDDIRTEISNKYIGGMTSIALAKEYNCSVGPILSALKLCNVSTKNGSHYHLKTLPDDIREEAEKDIITQYNLSAKSIYTSAKKYNISIPTIRKILKSAI